MWRHSPVLMEKPELRLLGETEVNRDEEQDGVRPEGTWEGGE